MHHPVTTGSFTHITVNGNRNLISWRPRRALFSFQLPPTITTVR
jgi:hypothetical protein